MPSAIDAPGELPRCPLHPGSRGVTTCARCGNFMCVACTEGGRQTLCPTCRERLGRPGAFPLTRERWNVGGLLDLCWAAFRRDWLLLSASVVVMMAAFFMVGIVSAMLQAAVGLDGRASPTGANPFGALLVSFVVLALQFAVQGVAQIGLARQCLDSLTGRRVELGRMFGQARKVGWFLLVVLALMLLVAVPLALLIALTVGLGIFGASDSGGTGAGVLLIGLGVIAIPLVWLIIPFYFAQMELAYVDGAGALQVIRSCFAIARGHRLAIIGVGLLAAAIALLGLVVFCVGFVPSFALMQLILCGLYLTLRNGTRLPEPG